MMHVTTIKCRLSSEKAHKVWKELYESTEKGTKKLDMSG